MHRTRQPSLHSSINFFHEFPSYRGCLALEDIEENEEILFIPTEMFISSSPLVSPLNASQSLVVKLYTTEWGQVDSLLSIDFSDHPITWTDEERSELLRGSMGHEIFKSVLHKEFFQTWQYISDMHRDSKSEPDSRRFRNCYAVMLSRAFERNDELVIVPFADQLNHSSLKMCTVVENLPDGIRMVANRKLAAGEEVFNFYGDHSSTWMFLTHGFIEVGAGSTKVLVTGPWLTGQEHNAHGIGMAKAEQISEIDVDVHAGLSDELLRYLGEQWRLETDMEIVLRLYMRLDEIIADLQVLLIRLQQSISSSKKARISRDVISEESRLLSKWRLNIEQKLINS